MALLSVTKACVVGAPSARSRRKWRGVALQKVRISSALLQYVEILRAQRLGGKISRCAFCWTSFCVCAAAAGRGAYTQN
jgi:hypothetical protein